MTLTATLTQADLAEAVTMLLAKRGMRAVGDITVNHFAGDQREPSSTTVTVKAESFATHDSDHAYPPR